MTNLVFSKMDSTSTNKVITANRIINTQTELEHKKYVHRLWIRYSVNKRSEPNLNRRANLAFKSVNVLDYSQECFVHCFFLHVYTPRTNKEAWSNEVDCNRNRDIVTRKLLSGMAWKEPTFWENEDAIKFAQRIVREVKNRQKLFAKP